jgi:hypothetical protein
VIRDNKYNIKLERERERDIERGRDIVELKRAQLRDIGMR